MRKLLVFLSCIFLICTVTCVNVKAEESYDASYENPNTGYIAMIMDDANLLSYSEVSMLLKDMKPITEYGDVAFCSTNNNIYSSATYAEILCEEYCSRSSGTIFLIDMDNRNIYL